MVFIVAVRPTAGTLLIVNFLSELQSQRYYAGGVLAALPTYSPLGNSLIARGRLAWTRQGQLDGSLLWRSIIP